MPGGSGNWGGSWLAVPKQTQAPQGGRRGAELPHRQGGPRRGLQGGGSLPELHPRAAGPGGRRAEERRTSTTRRSARSSPPRSRTCSRSSSVRSTPRSRRRWRRSSRHGPGLGPATTRPGPSSSTRASRQRADPLAARHRSAAAASPSSAAGPAPPSLKGSIMSLARRPAAARPRPAAAAGPTAGGPAAAADGPVRPPGDALPPGLTVLPALRRLRDLPARLHALGLAARLGARRGQELRRPGQLHRADRATPTSGTRWSTRSASSSCRPSRRSSWRCCWPTRSTSACAAGCCFRLGVLLPLVTSVVAVAVVFTQLFGRDYGMINWVLEPRRRRRRSPGRTRSGPPGSRSPRWSTGGGPATTRSSASPPCRRSPRTSTRPPRIDGASAAQPVLADHHPDAAADHHLHRLHLHHRRPDAVHRTGDVRRQSAR